MCEEGRGNVRSVVSCWVIACVSVSVRVCGVMCAVCAVCVVCVVCVVCECVSKCVSV